MNIWIIIAGNVINDEANIIGITPAIANFNGICVLCAPTIFLPTTFFEYCTGILLSACCTNTTAVTSTIAPIIIPSAVNNPVVLKIPAWNNKAQICGITVGSPAIIPTNIIIDIPLPIPLLVICSPSHIKSAVPAISDKTTVNPVKFPVLINIPEFLYDRYIPRPSTKAKNNVRIFV